MEKITVSVRFKNMIEDVKTWANANRSEFILLLCIVSLGAFFRLYRIGEYMTFLGDEGRDAIIVRSLLVHADPILIGPGTSIGNMYLGPLYYYLIAPFLFLFNMSPIGPSIMVAVLGIATVFLVWLDITLMLK
jgi:4-amino-4-deoxy-L-arabinose transferase-like glycosyltransferase